ncbi:hypothetical protein B0H11DRAFT_2095229 [Mycena galericulata]|nr:hypothetical protein B0H11DRAFT_2095229 [Mycena galericulata]
MHPCLRIAEVLEMILSHLDPSQDSFPLFAAERFRPDDLPRCCNYNSLAALARTCKLFESPALDLLWKKQTLENLLRCLPPQRWTMDVVTNDFFGGWSRRILVRNTFCHWKCGMLMGARSLSSPLIDSDWKRPRIYAQRIRELHCAFPDRLRLALSREVADLEYIVRGIAQTFPTDMFPKLQTLHWSSNDFEAKYIPLFLHPGITTIELHPSSYCDPLSFLPTVADTCPELRDIVVASADYPVDRADAVSTFVRRFPSIKSLHVDKLNPEALDQISHLQSLLSLTLHSIPSTLPPISDDPVFPRLQKLLVQCGDIHAAIPFFRRCTAIPLASIDISFKIREPASVMSQFYAAVSTACDYPSLTSLRIAHYDWGCIEDEINAYPTQGATGHTLLSFTNLTFVHIGACLGFEVDDDTVADMARAWPGIVTLELMFRSFTTLRCLQSFARHCPDLESLKMTLDTHTIPDSPGGAADHAPQQRLRRVDVRYSEISVPPLEVARVLSHHFPNLRTIKTWLSGTNGELRADQDIEEYAEAEEICHHRQWIVVEKSLLHFAVVDRQ